MSAEGAGRVEVTYRAGDLPSSPLRVCVGDEVVVALCGSPGYRWTPARREPRRIVGRGRGGFVGGHGSGCPHRPAREAEPWSRTRRAPRPEGVTVHASPASSPTMSAASDPFGILVHQAGSSGKQRQSAPAERMSRAVCPRLYPPIRPHAGPRPNDVLLAAPSTRRLLTSRFPSHWPPELERRSTRGWFGER